MAIKYCDWDNGQDFSVKRNRTTAIVAYNAGTTYALDDLVHNNGTLPNRLCYKSVQSGNTGNPLPDPAWWVLVADGSYTLPFQSITDASNGLTGGDEVRVAKSPEPTALTGTLTFTENSTTVTGSSTLFTTELANGDFIEGPDGYWYEVTARASNTSCTLYRAYPSSTASGVTSRKLGVTSTGAAAAAGTQVQVINASGSSGNLLQISGGWDLSTQTQTGQTWFRQMHGTFATRNGYGLYFSSKNYTSCDKLNFLRYNSGIFYNSSNNNTITTATCNSNSSYGILYSSTSNNNTITTLVCNSNNSSGILYTSSNNNTITTATCNSNSSYGIYYNSSNNNTITTATCKRNFAGIFYTTSNNNTITTATCNSNGYGIHYNSSNNNTITTVTCNSNGYGIYYATSNGNTITTATCNSNTTNAFYLGVLNKGNVIYTFTGTGNTGMSRTSQLRFSLPALSIQDNNGNGSINYFAFGQTTSDTASARSGTCLKWTPSSATEWIEHVFKLKVATGTAYTVTFYLRKDSSFNGDIEAAIYNMGQEVIAYADKKPTSNDTYETKTISIANVDIIAAGIAELRIRVRGTAGNCFLDDISIATT